MRKTIIILITAILLTSCGASKKIELELLDLESKYKNEMNVENAIILAEFYNQKYTNNKEQVEYGLKQIADFKNNYPNELKFELLEGNLYTIYGGVFAKKLDYANAMRNINKGFGIIDELILENPDNYYFLLYRGINSASVPKMFERLKFALSDLEQITLMPDVPEEVKIMAYKYLLKAVKMNKDKEGYKELSDDFKTKYPNEKISIK